MRTLWQVHGVPGEDNRRRFTSWHIWHKLVCVCVCVWVCLGVCVSGFACTFVCLCVWFQVLADAVSRLVVDKFSELTDNFTSPHARRKVLAGVVMTTGRFKQLLGWERAQLTPRFPVLAKKKIVLVMLVKKLHFAVMNKCVLVHESAGLLFRMQQWEWGFFFSYFLWWGVLTLLSSYFTRSF